MTDFDPTKLHEVQNALLNGEAVQTLVTVAGRKIRLMLVPSVCWKGDKPELMIALEGHAVLFFGSETRFNEWQLMSSGFPILVAQAIVMLVRSIMSGPPAEPVAIAPATLLLENQPDTTHAQPTRTTSTNRRSAPRTKRAPGSTPTPRNRTSRRRSGTDSASGNGS